MRTRSWLVGYLWLLPALSLGAVIPFAGCARPPKPQFDNLYRGLSENLPRLDPGLLSGRRIVIDPGHGGHFPGTRGQDGLEESAVNLGVALYLWGLLHEAGADVYLTRSADKDFLGGPDSTVAADLQVRVDTVGSVRPDIVVSIHHNAQPQRDPAKNAVETYYKMGDPASRDLAFAVHRHLVRNLGIDDGEVRPGNYYILREVSVPAILGEGSYLTHPQVEAKLRLSEKHRLEAEAYFLGILEFFSRGTPVIEMVTPDEGDSVFTEVPVLTYTVTDVGGSGIDPGGIEMVVNGDPVRATLDPAGSRIHYRFPWDSPNGAYDVSLNVRNVLGNSSRTHEQTIRLDLPAEQSVFSAFPQTVPSGGTVFIRARLLDRRGLSIADGHRVAVTGWHRRSASGGWIPSASAVRGVTEVGVRDGVVDFAVDVPAGAAELRVLLAPRPGVESGRPARESVETRQFEHILRAAPEEVTVARSIVVLGRPARTPVDDVRFVTVEGELPAETRGGCWVLPGGMATGEVGVRAPGYRPVTLRTEKLVDTGPPDTLLLDPWYEGKLSGKRIVVNPEGDGGSERARGPLGLSGAYASLYVARYLSEYLEAAGALVRLARWTEETPLDRDIVALTNRFRADQYIEIRYRGGVEDTAHPVRTFHFPGSSRGRALATSVGLMLSHAIGTDAGPASDTVTYPLQQTACPAIIVQPPSLGRIDEELRLSETWYQRRQAYGIFCGLLHHAGVDSLGALNVVLTPDSHAKHPQDALSNWIVTVDDTWRLLTPPDGAVSFDRLPPGSHRVSVRRQDRTLGPVEVTVRSGDTRELRIALPPRP